MPGWFTSQYSRPETMGFAPSLSLMDGMDMDMGDFTMYCTSVFSFSKWGGPNKTSIVLYFSRFF